MQVYPDTCFPLVCYHTVVSITHGSLFCTCKIQCLTTIWKFLAFSPVAWFIYSQQLKGKNVCFLTAIWLSILININPDPWEYGNLHLSCRKLHLVNKIKATNFSDIIIFHNLWSVIRLSNVTYLTNCKPGDFDSLLQNV